MDCICGFLFDIKCINANGQGYDTVLYCGASKINGDGGDTAASSLNEVAGHAGKSGRTKTEKEPFKSAIAKDHDRLSSKSAAKTPKNIFCEGCLKMVRNTMPPNNAIHALMTKVAGA